ncbi:MAG TPA: VOC family protein [Pseudonocardia sp.]|nr:VOC family protein [Pseudonocardia sp.]
MGHLLRRVDDLDKALARVGEMGGSRVMGPVAVGGSASFAVFADPDGNVVGMFSER